LPLQSYAPRFSIVDTLDLKTIAFSELPKMCAKDPPKTGWELLSQF
jgi:hypothetical protein